METMINNFLNGNLSDAKEQAKNFGLTSIAAFLEDEYGWTRNKARRTADYLKGRGTYQAACDAV